MLGPEPLVLDGRQAFLDAQAQLTGPSAVRGFYTVGWYGSSLSDERGSFGVVDPAGPLADLVGDVVEVTYYPLATGSQGRRSVRVYVIGSQQDLGVNLGITRRSYMALEVLAIEPITASVGVVG
jgi:hypothetical protein